MGYPFELTDGEMKSLGVTMYGKLDTSEIVFSEEIQKICATGQCRNYGKSWACPPAVGTMEECKARLLQYSEAVVFTSVYQLEDSFDFEGMKDGHREFKAVCDRVYEKLKGSFLMLSNEGCIRCTECTYPSDPCRYPEKLFPSLEGYGILVNKLADKAGVPYKNGENTVTYFGMICYNK